MNRTTWIVAGSLALTLCLHWRSPGAREEGPNDLGSLASHPAAAGRVSGPGAGRAEPPRRTTADRAPMVAEETEEPLSEADMEAARQPALAF